MVESSKYARKQRIADAFKGSNAKPKISSGGVVFSGAGNTNLSERPKDLNDIVSTPDYTNVNLPGKAIEVFRDMIKEDIKTLTTICDSPESIKELYSKRTHYAVKYINCTRANDDASYRIRNILAVKFALGKIINAGSISSDELHKIADSLLLPKYSSVRKLDESLDYITPFIITKKDISEE